ncbi:MAG: hypothetical protein H0U74_19185 [Bradymonadaceae bacterium]|nr:hypothetical protein [Lujinxingiaceae bacterium]
MINPPRDGADFATDEAVEVHHVEAGAVPMEVLRDALKSWTADELEADPWLDGALSELAIEQAHSELYRHARASLCWSKAVEVVEAESGEDVMQALNDTVLAYEPPETELIIAPERGPVGQFPVSQKPWEFLTCQEANDPLLLLPANSYAWVNRAQWDTLRLAVLALNVGSVYGRAPSIGIAPGQVPLCRETALDTDRWVDLICGEPVHEGKIVKFEHGGLERVPSLVPDLECRDYFSLTFQELATPSWSTWDELAAMYWVALGKAAKGGASARMKDGRFMLPLVGDRWAVVAVRKLSNSASTLGVRAGFRMQLEAEVNSVVGLPSASDAMTGTASVPFCILGHGYSITVELRRSTIST